MRAFSVYPGNRQSCAASQGIDDYRLYAMPYESSPGKLLYVVGFCEKDSIVRFAMITEHNGELGAFARTFEMRTNLKFRAKNQDN